MCLSKNALHTVVYVDTKDRLERQVNYHRSLITFSVTFSTSVEDPWIPIYEAVNFRVSPPIWNAVWDTVR
jgi:hypothetical protein